MLGGSGSYVAAHTLNSTRGEHPIQSRLDTRKAGLLTAILWLWQDSTKACLKRELPKAGPVSPAILESAGRV